MTAIPKPVRVRDSAYLKWIRTLPCLFSPGLNNPCDKADAHHVIPEGWGKMGSKVNDDQAVPLCRLHHQMAHDYPTSHGEIIRDAIPRLQATYRKEHPGRIKRERKTVKRPFRKLLRVWCACNREGIGFPIFEDKAGVEQYQRDVERLKFMRCVIEPEGRWRR